MFVSTIDNRGHKYNHKHERKKQNPQTDTIEWEREIDQLVYRLYELIYEEVKIIDPEIEQIISKDEYEKVEIKQKKKFKI